MTLPLIGLDADVRKIPRWGEAAAVLLVYVRAVSLAGGVPIVVPPTTDEAALQALLARLDGMVFTGGWDMPPGWYGQKKHPLTRQADQRRLAGDRALGEAVLRSRLPVLGICLGCQLVNVLCGGDLVQHLPDRYGYTIRHFPKETFHQARIEPGSRLAGILGRESLEVNSSHHQALGRIGSGLRPVAWAPDGIVEGVEAPGERFLLAVQWHPERLADRPEHLAIFRALIEAAANR